MKKVLFMAVTTCLFLAACGNNGSNNSGNTKGNKEADEPKVEVVIPDNFTEYDCSGFTISYPNDLEISWDGDEMVNLSNDDGSVFIDATFSSWGTREIKLKETVKNFIGLLENQGWEAVGKPEVKGYVAKALLKNDEEFNHFFIISNGKDHTVSGSVKYDQEMASVYDDYVMPIIYSIKVK
jgi:hypothetical protein